MYLSASSPAGPNVINSIRFCHGTGTTLRRRNLSARDDPSRQIARHRRRVITATLTFEILLTHALRVTIGEDRQPFHLLSPERAENAEQQWRTFVQSSLDRDVYSALLLADKKALAKKIQLCGASKSRIESEFSAIEKHLRDPIAHGSEYAQTREKAVATIKAARFLRNWITALKQDIRSPGTKNSVLAPIRP
jgi:hypothetical protein